MRKRKYLIRKESARTLVHSRLAYYNQAYQFPIKRVAIRDQRSRWGSCSKKGNLNFNWRVVLLPPALADYVVVHELCHLGEFNHSAAFWALVAKTVPHHKTARKWLKAYSVRRG